MNNPAKKPNILFVCTGNSCRSQMAEGWARHLLGDEIEAFSAGVCPFGVSSRATLIMSEAGVDISSHTSKHIDELRDIIFDYVVTLCPNAAQLCPQFEPGTRVLHMPINDPTAMIAGERQVMQAFRRTRDQIRALVEKLPAIIQKDKNQAKEVEFA